ncbi:hypothetical protein CBD41_03845 [bacterium TMED181]|nr:hypothetical protein [Planctomycetota bacterium]OUW45509.1 MAG: hypothetical protein CBD41_03845 [bacterium TMED181]
MHPEIAGCEQIGGLYGFPEAILVVILYSDLREIRGHESRGYPWSNPEVGEFEDKVSDSQGFHGVFRLCGGPA